MGQPLETNVVERIRRHISSRANLDRHVALIAQSGLFDRAFYNESVGRSFETDADAIRHYLLKGEFGGGRPNPLFDGAWYKERYPDVAAAGRNALLHYIVFGNVERRDPHPLFLAAYYVGQYADEAEIADPLRHFLRVDTDPTRSAHPLFDGKLYLERNAGAGKTNRPAVFHFLEHGDSPSCVFHPLFDAALYIRTSPGRRHKNVLLDFLTGPRTARTHVFFDADFYLETNEDLADVALHPLVHYVLRGNAERRAPHPVFDQAWYVERYPEASAVPGTALGYFLREGGRRGHRPNRYFDAAWYADTYASMIGRGELPIQHYVTRGLARDLQPSPAFDPAYYLDANPDVRSSNMPAFVHFMQFGRFEHRRPRAPEPGIEVALRGDGARVNLIGPLTFISGLGRSARAYMALLQSVGVEVNAINCESGFERLSRLDIALPARGQPAPVNIVHLNPDLLLAAHFLESGDLADLLDQARRNILIFYWELPTLKPDWLDLLARFDEVWCPTTFIQAAVRAVSPVPARLLRPDLSPADDKPVVVDREALDFPADRFIFAYFADGGSVLKRKNPEALIQAFIAEFDEDEQAFCFIKIHYSIEAGTDVRRLERLIGARRDVVIGQTLYDEDEMRGVFQAIDCYVSPHRSEGLGLTIIEAMQNGKPVIATPFGGAGDIIDDTVAYPLDYTLTEVGPGCDPYPAHFVWSEPSIASLRRQMRAVFVDRPGAARKAAAARAALDRLIVDNRAAAAALFDPPG